MAAPLRKVSQHLTAGGGDWSRNGAGANNPGKKSYRPPRPNRRRWRRVAVTVLIAIAVTSAFAAVLAETGRSTLLRRTVYDKSLDGARAYERFYTQVLPDPAAAAVTGGLLSRLPIDRTLVTANLRVVLPPSTLRGIVDGQLDRILDYLHGRRPTLDLAVDVAPLFGNIAALADLYIGREVAAAPTYRATSLQQLTARFLGALSDIGSGKLPGRLPALPLTAVQARDLARAVLATVPAPDRAGIGDQLQVLLTEGDVSGALALVGPLIFSGTAAATRDLSARLEPRHRARHQREPFHAAGQAGGRRIAWFTGWVRPSAGSKQWLRCCLSGRSLVRS